ncbi:MAG: serine hydrolase domain-containing protein [Chitinophagaceae bacterium]
MRYFLIAIIFCRHLSCFSQEIKTELLNTFTDSFLLGKIGSGEYGGLGIVVVKDATIVLKKGFGYAQNKIPVNPEQTLFGAASIGKLIVATAVMQLVESGRLHLTDKVTKYVKINNPFNNEITIGDVLSHTAGIEDSFLGAQTKVGVGKLKSLKEFFEQRPPRIIYEPSGQISYSNIGMALAGYIVERVTGISFNEYVEKNIFQPLKMYHSSFRQPLPDTLAALAVKDRRFGENSFIIPYPSGSLFTSIEDMGHFIIAHLNEGNFMQAKILQPATIKLMHQTYFSPAINVPCMALGFMESIDNGRKALFHTGSRFTQSIFYLLPQEKVGIYIVQYGYDNSLRKEYLHAFLNTFFPAVNENKLTKAQFIDKDLQKWTGF